MRFWPFGGNYECYGLGCRGGLGADLAFARTTQPTTLVAALPTQTVTNSRYLAVVAPVVQTAQVSRTVLTPDLPVPSPYVPVVEPLVQTTVRRTVESAPVLNATLPMTVADPSRDATLFSQPDLRPTLISTQQPTAAIVEPARPTTAYVTQDPRVSVPVDPVQAVKPPRVASTTGSGTNYEPVLPEPLPAYDSERVVQYSRTGYAQEQTYEPSDLDKAFEQQNYQDQWHDQSPGMPKTPGWVPEGSPPPSGQQAQAQQPSSAGTTAVLAAGAAVLALMFFGGKSGGVV